MISQGNFDARLNLNDKFKKLVKPTNNVDKISPLLPSEYFEMEEQAMSSMQAYSTLAEPLDSSFVVSPFATLLSNNYSSLITSSDKSNNDFRLNKSPSFTNSKTLVNSGSNLISQIKTGFVKPNIHEIGKFIQLKYLQRKAQLEKSAGLHEEPIKTYNEAIKLVLDTDSPVDYESCKNLVSPSMISLSIENITESFESNQIANNYDLLNSEITNNYIIYSVDTFNSAKKIQELFISRKKRRITASTKISKYFRGYVVRRDIWILKNRRELNARLIQKQYRYHLKLLHQLASKIKRWYKSRNNVYYYHQILQIFRSARMIQKIIRGYLGRKLLKMKKKQKFNAIIIQRNVRKYIMNNTRFKALRSFHKLYYFAAVKLQRFCRMKLAIPKAREKLYNLFVLKEKSSKLKQNAIEYLIKYEIKRVTCYLKSKSGLLNLKDNKFLIKNRNLKIKSLNLNQDDYDANEAIVALETIKSICLLSNHINRNDIILVLQELCIYLPNQELNNLLDDLDINNIDYNYFIDWYISGEVEYNESLLTTKQLFIRNYYIIRKLFNKISGIDIVKRSKIEIYKRMITYKVNDILTKSKYIESAKYQCCRCYETFFLFTDYYSHYTYSGLCKVTNQMGLYFKEFWKQRHWLQQRQIEYEIINYNNEKEYISYITNLYIYDDIRLDQSYKKYIYLIPLYQSCYKNYYNILHKSKNINDLKYIICENIYNTINLFEDFIINPYVYIKLLQLFHIKISYDIIITNTFNKENFILLLFNQLTKSFLINRLSLDISISYYSKLLSKFHCNCLLHYYSLNESILISLNTYRYNHPRIITIPDEYLELINLKYISKYNYDNIKIIIYQRINKIYNIISEYLPILMNTSLLYNITKRFINYEIINEQYDSCIKYINNLSNIMNNISYQYDNTLLLRQITIKILSKKLSIIKYNIYKKNNNLLQQYINQFNYYFELFAIEDNNNNILNKVIPKEDIYLFFNILNINKNLIKLFINNNNNILYYNKQILLSFYEQNKNNNQWINIKKYWNDFIYKDAKIYLKLLYNRNLLNKQKYMNMIKSDSNTLIDLHDIKIIEINISKIINNFNNMDNYSLTKNIIESNILNRYWDMLSLDFYKMYIYENKLVNACNYMINSYGYLIPKENKYSLRFFFKKFYRDIPNEDEIYHNDDIGWDLAIYLYISLYNPYCQRFIDIDIAIKILNNSSIINYLTNDYRNKISNYAINDNDVMVIPTINLIQFLKNNVSFSRGYFGIFQNNGKLSIKMINSTLQNINNYYRYSGMKSLNVPMNNQIDLSVLLFRCQMIAIRQVTCYLSSSLGQFHLLYVEKIVVEYWKKFLTSNRISYLNIIRYSIWIHSKSDEIIITELPHVIRHLIDNYGFKTNSRIRLIAHSIAKVTNKDEIFHLTASEAFDLIKSCFNGRELTKVYRLSVLFKMTYRKGMQSDAKLKILSNARREAVLISMGITSVEAAETNYRCSVLGLVDVMNSTKNMEKMNPNNDVNRLPKAVIYIYLCSKGFNIGDFNEKTLENFMNFESGEISSEEIDLTQINFVTNNKISIKYDLFSWLKRRQFKRDSYIISNIIRKNMEQVKQNGSKYIKEIINGISSCVSHKFNEFKIDL